MKDIILSKKSIRLYLLYIFLLLPFFEMPYLFILSSTIGSIYKIHKIISGLLIIFLVLKDRKYSKIINYIVLYLLVLIISTMANNGDYQYLFSLVLGILTLSLITDYGLRNHTNYFLKAFELMLSILVYMNFLTIVLNPNGLYIATDTLYSENWLLGYRNSLILYVFPALLCSAINSYRKKERLLLRTKFLFTISLISTILSGSSTLLVGLFLIFIFMFFKKIFIYRKILNTKTYLVSYIAMFFGIIIFRIQNLFSFIIVNVLKRDLTFTGRIYIWDYVIEFIKSKPLLGYGVESTIKRYTKTKYWRSFHAHNMFLEVLYKTGFIGLIIFIKIISLSSKELYKTRNNLISKYISWLLFTFMILLLMEAYSFIYIFYIFVFAFNIKYLIKRGDV